MNDLISRSGVVALILSGKVDDDSPVECPDECNSFLEWAAEEVGKMPPVERKKGRWIQKEDPYGFFDTIPVCSECGHTTKMRETYNYCPNCGAEMRGEEG